MATRLKRRKHRWAHGNILFMLCTVWCSMFQDILCSWVSKFYRHAYNARRHLQIIHINEWRRRWKWNISNKVHIVQALHTTLNLIVKSHGKVAFYSSPVPIFFREQREHMKLKIKIGCCSKHTHTPTDIHTHSLAVPNEEKFSILLHCLNECACVERAFTTYVQLSRICCPLKGLLLTDLVWCLSMFSI